MMFSKTYFASITIFQECFGIITSISLIFCKNASMCSENLTDLGLLENASKKLGGKVLNKLVHGAPVIKNVFSNFQNVLTFEVELIDAYQGPYVGVQITFR